MDFKNPNENDFRCLATWLYSCRLLRLGVITGLTSFFERGNLTYVACPTIVRRKKMSRRNVWCLLFGPTSNICPGNLIICCP